MLRNNRRALLLAVLVLLCGVSAAQAETAPWTPVGTIVRPFCNITVIGVGETSAEALDNALAQLKSDYLVFSYRVVRSRCDTTEIPDPTPLNPFATQEVTICWAELSACGIRKAVVLTNP